MCEEIKLGTEAAYREILLLQEIEEKGHQFFDYDEDRTVPDDLVGYGLLEEERHYALGNYQCSSYVLTDEAKAFMKSPAFELLKEELEDEEHS